MLSVQRLAEIRRFYEVFTERMGDPEPLNGFERSMCVTIIGELLDHAEETPRHVGGT